MSVKISRILHAGYIFESDNHQIAFDPIFENPFSHNCYPYPNVEFNHDKIRQLKFDAVFISHYHDDHFSIDSLNLLDKNTPIYAFSVFDELFSLIKELGFSNVYPLVLNASVQIGPFEIIPRPALDVDVDSIFHIKVNELNILNVVDSWIDFETLEILKKTKWDLILWPFQTMRELEVLSPTRFDPYDVKFPIEWMNQISILNPRTIVPSSCQFRQETWSWYNEAFFPISYSAFKEKMESISKAIQVLRMNPSTSIELDLRAVKSAASLTWITPIGDQNIDYEYNPKVIPQKTSEIAKNFKSLSKEQIEFVYSFCETALLTKYRSMEIPDECYFDKTRIWKLSVIDTEGKSKEFTYKINMNSIELISTLCDNVDWSTEIIATKFYSALKKGESLSSIYIRINDMKFDTATELEIAKANVLDDPLIRVLFNNVPFGSYQKAQLARLTKV